MATPVQEESEKYEYASYKHRTGHEETGDEPAFLYQLLEESAGVLCLNMNTLKVMAIVAVNHRRRSMGTLQRLLRDILLNPACRRGVWSRCLSRVLLKGALVTGASQSYVRSDRNNILDLEL